MKKIITLSITIIITLILTSIAFAQETKPLPPKIPKKIPNPNPAVKDKKVGKGAEADKQDYDVPLIGKENLKAGKIKLSAEIEELIAEAFIETNTEGTTQLNIFMSNADNIAKDKIYFVWLVTSEGKYSKIGEVSYSEKTPTAEIKGKVPMSNFGIFITVEDGKVEKPTSKTYAAFKQETSK